MLPVRRERPCSIVGIGIMLTQARARDKFGCDFQRIRISLSLRINDLSLGYKGEFSPFSRPSLEQANGIDVGQRHKDCNRALSEELRLETKRSPPLPSQGSCRSLSLSRLAQRTSSCISRWATVEAGILRENHACHCVTPGISALKLGSCGLGSLTGSVGI